MCHFAPTVCEYQSLNLFNAAIPGDLDKRILEKIMTRKKSGDDRRENDDIDDDTMQ